MIANPDSREPPALVRQATPPGRDEPVTAARGKRHGKKQSRKKPRDTALSPSKPVVSFWTTT
jgi:hypothetical protein